MPVHSRSLRSLFPAMLIAAAGLVPSAFTQDRPPAHPAGGVLANAFFELTYDGKGMTGLKNPGDPFKASVLGGGPGGRPGDWLVRYRIGPEGDWLDLYTDETRMEADPVKGVVTYTDFIPGMPLKMTRRLVLNGPTLDCLVDIETAMEFPVTVGDLAVALPWRSARSEDPVDIFERSFTKHHFISGDGSFVYFTRTSGEPPYLVATVLKGTGLEYFSNEMGGGYRAFVHSGLSGGRETRGTWRQAHTFLDLAPAGAPGGRASYGIRFQWAASFDEVRDILFKEGLPDVRVVPGMTVPEDLTARVAVRVAGEKPALEAEYPQATGITPLGSRDGRYLLFDVKFARLGENKLTLTFGGGRKTYLEFFVTEPLETLIRKRSAFITGRQQHRDPSKWYDGLFSIYDMKNKVLRGPDNTDGFDHWWGYVLASDDPALGKAPYVAAKNAAFPDAGEIASVEYYLQHYVWGKLQRSDLETPYPYGVYGTPNWMVCRDPLKRAGLKNRNLDKMNVWRAYDYPHMIMLYYEMYRTARLYPGLVHYLDAAGYLERAYQTARAFYLYPYEILPYYEIYKWGFYNELVVLDLIDALEKEGHPDKAAFLRGEWEKKVKYFVYDDKYPYRSEYAVDRTAFESSYALAKYGAGHDMKPDVNLWFDKNAGVWRSHPKVDRKDALAFMERQLKVNLALRGVIEPAYYLMGADFTSSQDYGTMSYMAAMGGWSVLDQALNFASGARACELLRVGYASFLSSWALMNTGRPDTGYGYWFPGPENDGAAGWTFMTAKFGRSWLRREVARGPWPYDGEIDLGFGGALRSAATVVASDPIFGWTAFGGSLREAKGGLLEVVPRDGLRQRFDLLTGDRCLALELEGGHFSGARPVVLAGRTASGRPDRLRFVIEGQPEGGRAVGLMVRLSGRGACSVYAAGRPIGSVEAGGVKVFRIAAAAGGTVLEIRESRP